MRREELTRRLRDALENFPEVLAVYLFGSVATRQAGPRSDVDLGVLLPEAEPRRLVAPLSRLHGELERVLGVEVDLVDLRSAPPDLVHRVLRDAKLIVDREPSTRVRFEVQARNAYFDVLPHLERYRRAQGH